MTRFLLLAACALTAMAATQAPRVVARYAGALPCADCAALKMELSLFADADGKPGAYEERLTYVDARGADRVREGRGRWSVTTGSAANPGDSVYELVSSSGERQFLQRSGDGTLRILDRERREIDSPRPQVLVRAEPEFAGNPVSVGEMDAGKPVTLRRGQELVLRMPSNPSTGYRWSIALGGPGVLSMVATPAYVRGPGAAPGAGGVEVWRFAAFLCGTETLVLKYARPWEKDTAPARTASFPVKAC